MNAAEAVRDMVARGLTHDHALIAIEVFENQKKAKTEAKLAHKREMDRARQQRHRSRVVTRDVRDDEGSSVTSVTLVTPVTRDECDAPPRARSLPGSKSKTSSSPSPKLFPPVSLRSTAPKGADDADERKNGKRLDPTWAPSDAHQAEAVKLGLSPQDLDGVAEEFRNYWLSEAGQRARKLDWGRTFTNRLREQAGKFQRQRNGGAGNGRGSLVNAGRELIKRVDAMFAEREVRPPDRDAAGDKPVRLLPSFGGQRS